MAMLSAMHHGGLLCVSVGSVGGFMLDFYARRHRRRIDSAFGGFLMSETFFKLDLPAKIKDQCALREEIVVLRSALNDIASLPPGSQGSYAKFERARCIAVDALKLTREK